MGHVFSRKKFERTRGKRARVASGNTITAKRFLKTLDASIMLKKEPQYGTKNLKN